jgi:hypothetical protein
MSVNGPPSHAVEEDVTPEPKTTGGGPSRRLLGSAGDWLFRDRRSGRIVVIHFPNLALWLWIATLVLRRFVDGGSVAREILEWAGYVTLGWWAIDELVRGVNPWRRSLGLVGCLVVVIGVVSRLGP